MSTTAQQKDKQDQWSVYDDFRESLATVDANGKRVWLYPRKPSGKFHNWRVAVTLILLAMLFAGPFMRINGQPALLLNVFERKFIILGQIFWPQDFFLLAIVLITFFLFIILFTVAFGRVWCGWMCPQTLFMEMLFRKVEYWIEGDGPAQKRLDSAPWDFTKIWKKTVKHVLFIALSVLIAHTVMAYLIGTTETYKIITHSPTEHPAGFIGLLLFTATFYGVYAKFREQACIAVCPYGRLQSVLLTKQSIVVAYDWLRGEPRTHLKKAATTATAGDCIDCHLCVQVCPTGIDIRNGTQLECVNCTACIDACDHVMEKINRPKGLIRYASHQGIEKKETKIVNARFIGYSVVLVALLVILTTAVATRSNVETNVFKVPGTLFTRDGDDIVNLYNLEFVNKTFEPMEVDVRVESPSSAKIIRADGKAITIPAEGMTKGVYFIRIPESDLPESRTAVKIGIYNGDKKLESITARFIGPVKTRMKKISDESY
ncbi:cytochrome c oxidase accessory protein CcoG [Chryseolinea sp. T2]|uniref:cytochrome c oxidase accessory protein CcoG n=1 Tax=Chryseolinea sp. T2 TaxID=3129255 RepID=UPI0030789830